MLGHAIDEFAQIHLVLIVGVRHSQCEVDWAIGVESVVEGQTHFFSALR